MKLSLSSLILVLAMPCRFQSQTHIIETVAGGGPPDNAQATTVGIGSVNGMTTDAAGNLYFTSNTGNAIWKLDRHGVLTRVAGISGVKGFQGDNGPATSAQLGQPRRIALDFAGNLYVADNWNHRIRKISNGVITTVAGGGSTLGDNGPANNARLLYPNGVAVDNSGNLYLADTENHRIRKVSNGVITTVVGNGTRGFSGDNGQATSARLSLPHAVAVDSSGNLYIADTENHRIRRVSNGVITTVAGTGVSGYSGDNSSAGSSQLSRPTDVLVDSAGNLFVADSGNHRIRRISNGVIATVSGNGAEGYSGDNGPAVAAQLNSPESIALDLAGSLFIADIGNQRIRKVANGSIATIAGNGNPSFSGDDGIATSAQLHLPSGVAVQSTGDLYIGDYWNGRIRMVSNGVMTTVAGSGASPSSGGIGPATSIALVSPGHIAIHSDGDLYFADNWDSRVRKVSKGMMSAYAGTGNNGFSGDQGAATSAQLNNPMSVAVDSTGNLYIADTNNHRVRKVVNGVISTVAGLGAPGYSGDGGPASAARLAGPAGLAVDADGNLYVADTGNERIRKISGGIITTVAGNGSTGYSGDNGPAINAQLDRPWAVAVDSSGNLYIADSRNHRIRLVAKGTITTFAGTGTPGFGGDHGEATSAQLNEPRSVALDANNNLYIADTNNNRIRKVTMRAAETFVSVSAASFSPGVPLAPGMIAAGYGVNLAPSTEIASATGPLPSVLAQTSIQIRDSAGMERTAPLWFVSPSQINYYIPEQTAEGSATVAVVRNSQTVAGATVLIHQVSPGLFTMNANGQGVPAAIAISAKSDGSQSWQYVFNLGCHVGTCQPAPIDLGSASDLVFLQLYGTGIRGRTSLSSIIARIGGVEAPADYAGAVPGMVGLDQVNLRIPRTLAGRGQVDVSLSIDGRSANSVRISIQ